MGIGNIKPKLSINQSVITWGKRVGKYVAIAALLAGGVVSYNGQDTVKAAACAAPTSDLGVDSLSFTAPATAEYTIWTRMIAPDAQNNTINLELDGNTCYNVGGGSFVATTWADTGVNWVNYANGTPSTPIRLQLTQGAHTLKYVGTKTGVQVDRIIVTSDATCIPVAKGTTDASGRSCDTGDSTPPTANVVSPANNTSNVVGTVTISATAADPSGIAKVDFLVNNQVVGTDSTGPDYSFAWNSASVTNGNQSITVQATDKAGNTTTSTAVVVVTNNLSTCSGTPSVPANLRVASASGTSVSLAWDASTAAENCQLKEYRIFRDGTQVTSVSSATTFNDTGLTPGATHSYTVAAVDSSGHASAQSTAVNGVTSSDSQAPTVPADLRTSLVTANSVALAWTASTDNNAVASYVIYRNGTQVGTSTTTGYSDTSVSPNTSYTYTVAARDAANNISAQSAGLATKTLDGVATVQSKMYVSPASGTQAIGSQFTVAIRTDIAATAPINSAQADLTYSSNLEYVSIDAATSDYGFGCPIKSGGSGVVSVACIPSLPASGQPSLSGDKLMANVTFKVLSAGTGTIEVQNTSLALSATNSANVLTSRQGGSYTLSSDTTPTPTPPTPTPPTPTPPTPTPPTPTPTPPTPTPTPTPTTPTPTPTPSKTPSPSPTPTPSTSSTGTTTKTTTTTITPEGNATPVTLPNDSEVELSDPVVVQTVPDSSATVQKVEYYLNGKLIATIKEPPYTYSVQTGNLRNGKYQLTTKTYYEDGTTDTNNSSLTVKNPLSFKQVMLQIGGFAWIIIIVLIIAAAGVWYAFFRKRDDGGDYTDSDGYMFGPTNTTTPSGPTYTPPGAGGQYGTQIEIPSEKILPTFATDLSRY
jgi:chitodextrinase/outer membrane biosynthesis protein TonB